MLQFFANFTITNGSGAGSKAAITTPMLRPTNLNSLVGVRVKLQREKRYAEPKKVSSVEHITLSTHNSTPSFANWVFVFAFNIAIISIYF
jgi:hypothetical protein